MCKFNFFLLSSAKSRVTLIQAFIRKLRKQLQVIKTSKLLVWIRFQRMEHL